MFGLAKTRWLTLGLLCLCWSAEAARVQTHYPARLTHNLAVQLEKDFGDPSAPDFSIPDRVSVYTTNGHVLTWKTKGNVLALDAFLSAKKPTVTDLKAVSALGRETLELWDPSIQVFSEWGAERILYAGIATDAKGLSEALWPDENWRRRVNAFRWDKALDIWIQIRDSVLGEAPQQMTWRGHSYGHHFIQDHQGYRWMFYEKVNRQKHGLPWVTSLYARRVLNPFELAKEEILIFDSQKDDFPATKRDFGGHLAEGPRPFFWQGYYFVAFSAGDYTSDRYGIHLLWSKSVTGPYHPYLNRNASDLYDWSSNLEKRRVMTWGAARPVFFEARGQLWMLYHGIEAHRSAQVERGLRDVFIVPVHVRPQKRGPPKFEFGPGTSAQD